MDPLRGENRPRVPYLVGAIPFGAMVLLLTWVVLPLADFEMDAQGKVQWTALALLAVGGAAVADRRSSKATTDGNSEPTRFAGIELRVLTPVEKAMVPKWAFGFTFVVLFAVLIALGDSWITFPVALIAGGLLSLATVRYAQQQARNHSTDDGFPLASETAPPEPSTPDRAPPKPLRTFEVVIVTVGVVILIISVVAVAANW